MTNTNVDANTVKETLDNLKSAISGLSSDMNKLLLELELTLDVAKYNGGQLPNVNEIVLNAIEENN